MTETIGFIGVGNMGWPMAANLVRAGHKLIVYDINLDQAQRFATEQDNTAVNSLAGLGKAVDVVITMLPTGQHVREVMLEEEEGGLVKSLKSGALLIDMSSSDPIGTQELGEVLADKGIQFVDAPVSGGVSGAHEATLAIMIGSNEQAAIARARPILSALGKRLFETGPLGSGHAMKALNNSVASAGFIAVAEALIIGRNFGLDPGVMIKIINSSTGRNFNSEFVFPSQVLNKAYATGFNLELMSKDVKIAADLGEALGLDVPVAELVSERWLEVLKDLGSGKDFTEAYPYWESKIKTK